MARLAGCHVADYRAPQEIEVADQVEHLMTRELVRKAQRRVHDFLVIDEDQIVETPAARETHLRQFSKLTYESEGSRRRNLVRVRRRRRHFKMYLLHADRPRVFECIVDNQPLGRLDPYIFAISANGYWLLHRDRFDECALLLD